MLCLDPDAVPSILRISGRSLYVITGAQRMLSRLCELMTSTSAQTAVQSILKIARRSTLILARARTVLAMSCVLKSSAFAAAAVERLEDH